MKKKILYTVLATLCLIFNAKAQTHPILLTGQVSEPGGKAIPNATLKIIGERTTALSNAEGKFVIKSTKPTGKLTVSHIGFKTAEFDFNGNSLKPFRIILKEDNSQLKEVDIVSTGYQNIPKERATGAFTTIDTKTIKRNVGINILDRLEGVTSGLLLNRNLPTQGSANNSKISIRGRSTIFANSEPLIVLDGFPYEGNIDHINAADIETINILKDAAAASIWGTRASNGVIVLTSKSGRKNQKLRIGISSTLTVSDKPNLYYVSSMTSSDYIDLEQFLYRQGFYDYYIGTGYSSISPAVEIFEQRKKGLISVADSTAQVNSLKGFDVRKDLQRYAYRRSIYQQYQMNLKGGSESNRYYLSGGYDKNIESSFTDDYSRFTLNASNTYSLLKDKLEITAGINFISSHANSKADSYIPGTPYDRLADDMGNSLSVVNSSTLRQSYVDTVANEKLLNWHYRPKDEFNPNTLNKQLQYKIDLGIDYKIIDGLNLTVKYQYLKQDVDQTTDYTVDGYYARNVINKYSSIVDNQVVRGVPLGGILNKHQDGLVSKIVRLQLNYNKNFQEDHEINIIGGYEGADYRINASNQRIYGFDSATQINGNNQINPLSLYHYYYEPGISSLIQTAPDLLYNINISQSYYANAAYSYKHKYVISGSVRKDESNLFGVKMNQKGVPLWSSGLAWIIDKEKFYDFTWLPSLKLRATYGYNGNVDKTVSAYLTVLNQGKTNEWISNYSQIANPPNPFLKWEKVKTWNFGLDFSFKNSRISGSIDLYQKNAIDLIGNNPIAMQSGVTQFRGNGASLKSKGIDLLIKSENLTGKIRWANSLLLNYNTDKVTSYKIKQTGNRDIVGDNFINPIEGYPYYAIFSFPSAGLDATGSPQGYINGVISNDYAKIGSTYDPNQLKFHGTATPKYFGSLINTFNYKNIELTFNIVFKFDYYFRRSNVFNGFTTTSDVTDYDRRWQNSGDEDITKIPAFNYESGGTSGSFFRNSEDLVERADHIRLSDIRFSYTISNQLIRTSLFKNANIFLYTKNWGILWRKNKFNIDPDYGTINIPQSFSCSVGINLNF